MLEKIILENFQRHESLTVRFDPGVTTLVGPSDRGKTAVLRALRWVAHNEPSGTAFVRHGAAHASAAVRLDGRWVVRYRDKETNTYQLDGQTYYSLRAPSVPEAVSHLFNLGPVNLQEQHDPPFWLTATGGQVSRDLNAVVNLGEIDAVLAAAAADVSAAKGRVADTQDRLAAAVARRDSTAWAVAAADEFAVLEDLRHQQESLAEQCEALNFTVAGLEGTDDRLQEVDAKYQALFECLARAGAWADAQGDRNGLAHLVRQLDKANNTLARDPTQEWERVAKLRADGDRAAADRGQLETLTDEVDSWQKRLSELGQDLAVAEKRRRAALAGGCPVCGSPYPSS